MMIMLGSTGRAVEKLGAYYRYVQPPREIRRGNADIFNQNLEYSSGT